MLTFVVFNLPFLNVTGNSIKTKEQENVMVLVYALHVVVH